MLRMLAKPRREDRGFAPSGNGDFRCRTCLTGQGNSKVIYHLKETVYLDLMYRNLDKALLLRAELEFLSKILALLLRYFVSLPTSPMAELDKAIFA